MAGKRKLTAEEFDRISPHLQRFEKKNVVAIRKILVQGGKQKDVATQLGLSKEAVSAMVGRVWRIHLAHSDGPPGWVKVEAIFPPQIAEAILELAKVMQERASKEK